GIRDFHVTGVQTCALPIWAVGALDARLEIGVQRLLEGDHLRAADLAARDRRVDRAVEHEAAGVLGEQLGVRRAEERAVREAEVRSEERRVGKDSGTRASRS